VARNALGSGGGLFVIWQWCGRLLAPIGIVWIIVANF
jgi:hypothetical protein